MAGKRNQEPKGGSADATGKGAATDASDGEPFERSGSGAEYTPVGNWAAERERNGPSGGKAGMSGAPSGAGDGGFGPEGDFTATGDSRVADVLGEVNGDNSALVRDAQERGPRKADRRFTGGEGVDEPDGKS